MTEARRTDLLQRQARALGDPTRHRIFRLVEGAEEPLGVRELADDLGLHHSAVRQHLAKLVSADLVVEAREAAHGPGRPRSVYRRAPGVLGSWGATSPFERLAALLVDVVRTGASPYEAGMEAGLSLGPQIAVDAGDRPTLEILTGVFGDQGFEPEAEVAADGAATVAMGRCPYGPLALAAPEVVCQLHRGLAEGLVATMPTRDPLDVVALDHIDPVGGGCCLRLAPRGTPAAANIDSE